ncbi:C-terminal binding protein [Candidatus Latescibacterota bacterium]
MSGKITFKITDYIEHDLTWEEEECKKLGVDFHYYHMKESPPEEIVRNVGNADIILVNMAKFTPDVIGKLEKAKVIIRHGIGYDNLNVAAATENGIVCANEPTASSEDVAEQAIMLMFAAYRKIRIQFKTFDNVIESGKLVMDDIYPVFRMAGKTLGIVGCGNIGKHVLRKMQSFGMNILVSDPYLSPERLKELDITHTPLEEVLSRSDIVTIHVPVTEDTYQMFNKDTIGLMKKTAVIVNTSRAGIINVSDLARALRDGVIAGAGIDVHPYEPPLSNYELLGMDNVLLTPHLAWYSEEGGWDIRHMIMDDVRSFTQGGLPKSVLNPEVLNKPNVRMKL